MGTNTSGIDNIFVSDSKFHYMGEAKIKFSFTAYWRTNNLME